MLGAFFANDVQEQLEFVMTTRTTLIFRSMALAGAMSGALALLPTVVVAQAPRPDFPGAKQGDAQQSNSTTAPRPDFPGAKQGDANQSSPPRPDFPGPKQGDAQPQK
jgi:hypothetical protein